MPAPPILDQYERRNDILSLLLSRQYRSTHMIFLVKISPIIEQNMEDILPSLLAKRFLLFPGY